MGEVRKGFKRFKINSELARDPKSPSYYYDIIVSSPEIKKLILTRIKELDVDVKLVLKEAGITYHKFMKDYLREVEPVSTPALRQSHLISLCDVLGIKLSVLATVETDISKIRVDHLRYGK